jgi:hypothetical protein
MFGAVETSVTELLKIMSNTFYTWISAHHRLLVSSFADFESFFFFFFFFFGLLPILGVLLYTSCVLTLCLFALN